MNAKRELADLVDDHLSRNASVPNVALAGMMAGLTKILTSYSDAQERRGSWDEMLSNLRSGLADVEAALPVLRVEQDGVAAIVLFAEREVAFAAHLEREIVRLRSTDDRQE